MRLHDEPSSTNGHYPLKDFKAGSIVSLTLENFMSTDYTKYPFNPTTNYIFGANGTGKSTIVSALFIIFDGRIAKLGRADDLSMFVNRERPNKKARITVEISTGRGTTIGIQRSWCSGKNKNTKWKMRRERTSTFNPLNNKDELTRTINKYNLHVMNLMQFLPQEKVNDLSDLSSKDRLTAFQQAISDGKENLLEKHEKLIEYQKNTINAKDNIIGQERTLEDLKRDEERDKVRVERFQTMQKHKDKKQRFVLIKNYVEWTMKKELVEYTVACHEEWKRQHEEVKEKLMKDVNLQLAKLSKEEPALRKKLLREKNVLEDKGSQEYKLFQKALAAKAGLVANVERVQKYKAEVRNLMEENLLLDEQMKKKEAEYVQLRDAAEESRAARERQKEESRQEIEHLKKQIVAFHPKENGTRTKQEECEQLIHDLESKKIEVERKLSGFEQYEQNRINALRSSTFAKAGVSLDNTLKLWELIESNKSRFRAEVFPPAILSMGCQQKHLDIMINAIPINMLMTIVCQNAQDLKETNKLARENNLTRIANGRVDNINIEAVWNSMIDFKRLGFECALLEYLHGPDGVLAFLCQEARIQNVFYGKQEPNLSGMDQNTDRNLKTYFVYNKERGVFKKTVRRYNQYTGNMNTVDSHHGFYGAHGKAFTYFKDPAAESEFFAERANFAKQLEFQERRKHDLKKERQEINSKISALERDIQSLKEDLATGNHKEKQIKQVLRQFMSILRKKKNVPALVLEIQKFMKEQIDFSITNSKNIAKCLETLNSKWQVDKDDLMRFINVSGKKKFFEHEKAKRESQLRDQVLQGKAYSEDVDFAKGLAQRVQTRLKNSAKVILKTEDLKEIKKKVEKLAEFSDDFMPEERDYESGREFNKYEEELIEKIGLKIRECQSNYENLRSLGTPIEESDVQKYRDLVKNIQDTARRIEKLKKAEVNQASMTAKLKDAWYPELQKQIKFVAQRFKNTFATINCNADVELYCPDNPNNFSEYGLDIKVQYRAGDEMASISVNRQSGGERSVAAMLFLLSMPTKNCPFRLVDEINQGMDSYNEQNVYKVVKKLTDEATEDDMCQLFIISPKLLRNIEYSKRGSVSILHNSYPRAPDDFTSPQNELERMMQIEN